MYVYMSIFGEIMGGLEVTWSLSAAIAWCGVREAVVFRKKIWAEMIASQIVNRPVSISASLSPSQARTAQIIGFIHHRR